MLLQFPLSDRTAKRIYLFGGYMNGRFVPKRVFFTCGVGRSPDELTSFEMALRDASIECYNIVTVSSILPPKCRIISKEEALPDLPAGSIVFTVFSRLSSNEPHRRISASLGVAIPEDMESHWGYFTEHHSFGQGPEQVGRYAEKLAEDMFGSISESTLNRTMNVTKSAVVGDDGLWTSVIVAAVFLMD